MSQFSKIFIPNLKEVNRRTNDYYATPPIAIDCLINHCGSRIPENVWEPAAGRGWISTALADHGHNVYSSDLFEYDDPLCEIETDTNYLITPNTSKSRGIITNPPYKHKLAETFARKAISESDFVAFFLRLTFCESNGRYDFFCENPPELLIMSARIACFEENFSTDQGLGGMVAYAWYIWDKNSDRSGTVQWANAKKLLHERESSLTDFME